MTDRLADPERTNRDFWDRDADDYQAAHAHVLDAKGWGAYRIPDAELEVLGDLTGLDVLELGCGAAQQSLALAGGARRVVGLDQSRSQLGHAAAQRRHRASPTPARVRVRHRDTVPRGFVRRGLLRPRCDGVLRSVRDRARGVSPLATGGLLAFSISSLLHLLCYPTGDPDAAVTRTLHQPMFGAHVFDWGDGTIDFQLPHSEWIRLFGANGFAVEALLELQPPSDASTTYDGFTDLEWARRWPSEEIWKVRKVS